MNFGRVRVSGGGTCISSTIPGYTTLNDGTYELVRVDASRPDFEPGDRVRDRDDIGTVTHPPICVDGKWLVPVRFTFANNERGLGTQEQLWWASRLTKIPRETSVLLKLTGETAESCAQVIEGWKGVRVERVEDPDE